MKAPTVAAIGLDSSFRSLAREAWTNGGSGMRPKRRAFWFLIIVLVAGAVATAAATPLSPVTSNPSGVPMPVGDVGGWHQVLAEDFAHSAAFPGGKGYQRNWTAYASGKDTTGRGSYTTAGLSVHGGLLDIGLRSRNGVPQVAAPVAMQPSGRPYVGAIYGRYSIRFKAENVYGYKTAWMLWPDNNKPQNGEIDFPEGDLSGPIGAFNHRVGNHRSNATAVVTGFSYQAWHTATIVWLPSGVSFYLDGKLLGKNSNSPSVPMHWILQTETSTYGHVPAAGDNGHVFIDWATIYVPTASLLR